MKRLILINLLLIISLNILPKEVKVEQIVEVKVEKQIASRSLKQPRQEIQIEEPVPTDISEEGIEFIKQFERLHHSCKKT